MALARGVGGRLVVVGVPEIYGIDLAWYADAGMGGAGGAVPVQELMSEARTATADYLAQVSTRLADAGVPVETRMGELEPSEAILTVAQEEGAWVLALATHGLGGVTRWAFGSIADYVLRH